MPIADTASGPAKVPDLPVVHGRDGAAEWGLAVCDLPDGTRAYAKVDDPDLLAEMEADRVGRQPTSSWPPRADATPSLA